MATGAVVVVVVSFAGASSDAPFLVNLEKSPMSRASVLCRASFQETFRASFVTRKKVLKKCQKRKRRKEEEYFKFRFSAFGGQKRPHGMFFIRRIFGWMTKITRNGVTRETNDKKRKKENPNGKQRKGYLYLGSSARERERERERETHTTKPTAGLSSFTSSGTGGELSF